MQSPFYVETNKPLVAMVNPRAGYIQIAPAENTDAHAAVPEALFHAAQHWASFLQTQDEIAKVYWLQFSEVVSHLHWHLFPRYAEDILKGCALFEARNEAAHHREWPPHWQAALYQWAERFYVELLDPEACLAPRESLYPDYENA